MATMTQNSGSVKCKSFPKTASTALSANNLVTLTSGYLADVSSSTLIFAGILTRAVVAADDDYASATLVPCIELGPDATFLMATSGATQANVGHTYDISDGATLNLSGTTYNQFVVTKVISATQVEVKPNLAVVTIL